ncbi:MAG: lysophospholipid acyltransferase family protein [Candidatus Limnocylindria bacterium]
MLLRAGLEIADRVVAALPSGVAYRLADLAGDAWYRLAPARRRLVAANLGRVCAATGRPARGRTFTALVRAAFRHHARYYVELLRVPHYGLEDVDRMIEVPQWPTFEAAMRGRPSILVSAHVGNFEPFGTFLASRGIRPMSPIEEIEPRPLYEFLAAHRGGSHVDLVPLRDARRALSARLRDGGMVGIIGDRDITGGGQEVELFGHPTTIPTGPAFLAVTQRATLVAGRCLRTGPDRFRGEGEIIEVPDTGDRRADVATVAARIAARFERDIADAPEQWWGAFQPRWPDLPAP